MPNFIGSWTPTTTTLSAATVTKVYDADRNTRGFTLNDKTSGADLFYAWGTEAPSDTDSMIAVPDGAVLYFDPIENPAAYLNLYLYSTAGGDATHIVKK